MIQYDSRIWFSFLFKFNTGQLRRLLPSMALMAVFTALVCYFDLVKGYYKLEMPLTVHTLLGVVLGLVLVFRTNTAYERWWEGRRLLGALVNAARNLALKLNAYLPQADYARRQQFVALISAYALAIPKHLRETLTVQDLAMLSDAERACIQPAAHIPLAVMKLLLDKVQQLRTDNDISMEQFLALSQNLNELIDTLGGMERIKKTPIPFSYAMLIKRFIAAYIFSLPFGLMRDFGWAAVVIVPFIFYVMVGIEVIAEDIENPFGTDRDDLPTDDIAQNLSRNVKEILTSVHGEAVKEKVEGEIFDTALGTASSRSSFKTASSAK